MAFGSIILVINWCWHRWTRWCEPRGCTWIRTDYWRDKEERIERLSQSRDCVKCGKTQYRIIKDGN